MSNLSGQTNVAGPTHKRCTRCPPNDALKPLSEFYVSRIGARGFPIYCGHCKACDRKRCAAWDKQNRAWRRQWEKDWRKRKRTEDPEWAAVERERGRQMTRKARGYKSERLRMVDVGKDADLDPAPFTKWLTAQARTLGSLGKPASADELAKIIPLTARTLRAHLNGERETVYLSVVDAAVRAVDPGALATLYPLEEAA